MEVRKQMSITEFAEKISQVTREQVIEAANKVSIDTVYLLKGEGAENE